MARASDFIFHYNINVGEGRFGPDIVVPKILFEKLLESAGGSIVLDGYDLSTAMRGVHEFKELEFFECEDPYQVRVRFKSD